MFQLSKHCTGLLNGDYIYITTLVAKKTALCFSKLHSPRVCSVKTSCVSVAAAIATMTNYDWVVHVTSLALRNGGPQNMLRQQEYQEHLLLAGG